MPTRSIDRRVFIRAGSMALLSIGVDPLFLTRAAYAASATRGSVGKKTLVCIFQRGAVDGLNTVIPYGDSEYNTTNRPSLYIPQGQAIDLGNSFAGLHPMMQPMMEIYNKTDINGETGPGNLAILHRIGYMICKTN